MGEQLQSPDFEVIVRIAASDALVAACFLTGTDEFDVVVGIAEPSQIERYQQLLGIVATALNAASWVALDELDLHEAMDDEDSDGAAV